MADDWGKVLSDAQKLLGKTAKIPSKPVSAAEKASAASAKAAKEFISHKETMEKAIVTFEDSLSKMKNTTDQSNDILSSDNFGLDPSKADDKKKIAQAQAMFKKFFDKLGSDLDLDLKKLRELDKHLVDVKNYKTTGD